MSFLKSFAGDLAGKMTTKINQTMTNFIGSVASSITFTVQDVNPASYEKSTVMLQDGNFTLYKTTVTYEAVLYCPELSHKAFSLFRLPTEKESRHWFGIFPARFTPLYTSDNSLLNKSSLQAIGECVKEHPEWTTAHIAAQLGLNVCFRHSLIACEINSVIDNSKVTPLHLAVQTANSDTIQELLIHGANIDATDGLGNTVFHFAAKTNPLVIQLLATKYTPTINIANQSWETPLHVACHHDKPDCLEQMLRCGADPSLQPGDKYPMHFAVEANSTKCIETLCRWSADQIHVRDVSSGGTPLHWAKSKEMINLLCDLGSNINQANNQGETIAHLLVQQANLDCLVSVLSREADVNKANSEGHTLLHLAVMTDNVDILRTVIVFGADVNALNLQKCSARHITVVGTNVGKNWEHMLYTLHMVGAKRCPAGTPLCQQGCSENGTYDGDPRGNPYEPGVFNKMLYDEMIRATAVASAMSRSSSATFQGTQSFSDSPKPTGQKVLCLDGGGIRGLILVQLLLAIEKTTGRPIKECFDWISGTSTGGILALAITHGKSLQYILGLYMRFKDAVFIGNRPYDSQPLEKFMKQEFGEKTRMSDVRKPKVIVTGVLGDRHPADLHLFRNYEPPENYITLQNKSRDTRFAAPLRYTEQFLWQAARSSGAAPTYFRAMGRYLDGGLMSNNPTLDTLSEIHEYNMALKSDGHMENIEPISCVVSLGTGIIPVTPVQDVDLFRPSGIMEGIKAAYAGQAFVKLLIDQATISEGRPVERARAWCSMINVPYFRFSPQLSEDVKLDETNDMTLVRTMWETRCFIYANQEQLDNLAVLLRM
ncbi:unnamed protein product [Owenia fusiformis]|uniref:phospholipase A2 n=1 Tax=Owenia fusiformis TaxID=6347 RepID=A0A8J1UJH3_OWEFU|nr:unnamed protein product [Owenia fusiformis]